MHTITRVGGKTTKMAIKKIISYKFQVEKVKIEK